MEPPLAASAGALPLTRRSRPFWAGVLRLLVLAGGSFGIGLLVFNYVIMPGLLGHGDEVQVPDVVGRSLATARSMLEDEGLKIAGLTEQWSAVYPDGYVVGQAPSPLSLVKRGREVRLMVSVGREGQEVPDLTGAAMRDAQITLARAGLRVGRVAHTYSETAAKDLVIATDPDRGARVEPGARVDLLVSLGPPAETFLMPDLRGKGVAEVRALFKRAGIRVVERTRESYGAEPDVVLEQFPPGGYRIQSGELIEIVVSSPGRGGWR